MTFHPGRFARAVVCAAALSVTIVALAPAQQLSPPARKASPFSIEKGDSTSTKSTTPAEKPALIKAEEALDQGRPKDAVTFAVQAVKEEPNSGHAWFTLARAQQAVGNMEAAIAAGNKAATFASVRASAFYNLACAYATTGDKDHAFLALLAAKRAGFADRDQMTKDPDLASLRGDKRFVLPLERNFFTMKLKDGTDLPFAVDLPVDYDPAKAYPVLVAPGQGTKIKDSWGGLFWGEDTAQRGWIAVESPALMLEDPIGATGQLFDEIAKRYKVERNQYHLVGYGPSSAAAFGVAAVMPERVRSLWVLPGFPVGIKDEGLARLKPMKVCFIVGDADPYWYQESQTAYRKLKSLGVDAYLEVVQGGSHLLQEMFGGEFAERLGNAR
jgi:tetratricopeptide (TPR) repeat protein